MTAAVPGRGKEGGGGRLARARGQRRGKGPAAAAVGPVPAAGEVTFPPLPPLRLPGAAGGCA